MTFESEDTVPEPLCKFTDDLEEMFEDRGLENASEFLDEKLYEFGRKKFTSLEEAFSFFHTEYLKSPYYRPK